MYDVFDWVVWLWYVLLVGFEWMVDVVYVWYEIVVFVEYVVYVVFYVCYDLYVYCDVWVVGQFDVDVCDW